MRYCPSPLVTAWYVLFVWLFFAVIVAPGTGRPAESTTVPVRAPYRSCAAAGLAIQRATASSIINTRRNRITVAP